MWKKFFNNSYTEKEHLYFGEIMYNETGNSFYFDSSLSNKYIVTTKGFVYSYYVIKDEYALSYNDKYITKNDIEGVLQRYNFCYTDKSEYLDWFNKTSCNAMENAILYHFRIICDECELNFIFDDIPQVICDHLN